MAAGMVEWKEKLWVTPLGSNVTCGSSLRRDTSSRGSKGALQGLGRGRRGGWGV